MANIFNNDDISPLFYYILFAVCYIIVRKENHWIVFLIGVGQFSSLSTRCIFFFSEGLYRLDFILFSYYAASGLSFYYWSNAGWSISLIYVATFALKMVIISYFLLLNFLLVLEEWWFELTNKFSSLFEVEGMVV